MNVLSKHEQTNHPTVIHQGMYSCVTCDAIKSNVKAEPRTEHVRFTWWWCHRGETLMTCVVCNFVYIKRLERSHNLSTIVGYDWMFLLNYTLLKTGLYHIYKGGPIIVGVVWLGEFHPQNDAKPFSWFNKDKNTNFKLRSELLLLLLLCFCFWCFCRETN